MLGKIRIFALGALLILVSFSSQAQNKPEDVVNALNQGLLETMQEAKALGYEGRYKKLAPLLEKTYAFGEMAKVSTGSHWKNFSDAQKQSTAKAFATMSISTYAARFNGFSGERFLLIKTEEVPPPSPGYLIHTHLVKSDGEIVKLNYRLLSVDGVWKVIDVYYNAAISELANQRSQYLSILSTEGYDGLMKKLEAASKEMAERK